ncbi:TetR/AcrR family transcriptional regulator [Desulforamulus aquiferis]|uniref:TetR/AcrR family transcriptional regulator n=1 Tax=Desulforamulus aquiferis TaxID=1397668 RepID=A0AAW7ZJE7_9FIRM|nr:TetR/AcrR family transcriptional regulator [Desulforamulus aquiferis]MDO7789161.1 TetR/AcrR family transcriptional regulator [Desulforamulus aquiferis]RYD06149.1 hypothetical protein N752_04480 [Desulforamulus aquiferis]
MTKGSKKDLIADSALTCFLNSGYNSTSVDEIVKVSGVSKGGIYWHFKSKEDIFIYIIERQMNHWLTQYLSSLDESDSVFDKLTKYLDHHLQKLDTPILAVMSEFFMQTKDPEVINKLHRLAINRETILREIVAEAVRTGEFNEPDINAATSALVALIDGYMHQWMIKKDKQALEHNLRVALKIIIKGLQ